MTNPKTSGSPVRTNAWREKAALWGLALLPALAAFLCYLPALNHAFIWDDIDRIVENPNIRSLDPVSLRWMFTTTSGSYWMPLTWITFAWNYRMAGLAPWPYHLTNNVLHALNTLLVFGLALRVLGLAAARGGRTAGGRERFAAFLTAILFGLHPIHVESVAWATERKDVLYTFFYLASLLLYLGYAASPQRRPMKLYACLGLFLLSLMSKPMAISLPLVLLIADGWPLGRLRRPLGGVLTEKIPFLILAAASALFSALGPPSTAKIFSMAGEYPMLLRVLNAFRSLIFYMWKMLLPVDLMPLYPIPNARGAAYYALGFAAVLAVVLAAWALFRLRHRAPSLAAAGLFYAVTLAPALGLVQAGSQAAADRFAYLSSLGLFLPLSTGAAWWLWGRGKIPLLFAAALTVLLGYGTVNQLKVWKDPRIFWERIVHRYPNGSHFAHVNLAALYEKEGFYGEALKEYDSAIALPPRWAQARAMAAKGAVLAEMKREAEASEVLRSSASMDPASALPYQNLWVLYGRQKKFDRALEAIRKAAELEPSNAANFDRMALTYLFLGKRDEAIDSYKECIRLNPGEKGYYLNAGELLVQRGSYPEAADLYLTAYGLWPRDADLALKLGQAYDKAGMKPLAQRFTAEAAALIGMDRK